MHFHKFADFGSGKWSCPFLFSLNVWALLHNLSDHRYISCGKIWHHIHHGSNYAEKTKKKENKKRRRSSLTHRYILILTKAFFKFFFKILGFLFLFLILIIDGAVEFAPENNNKLSGANSKAPSMIKIN